MNLVSCNICPHNCTIKPGQRGICGVRSNVDGRLQVKDALSAIAVDPIEKKPLFHFFPGKNILSIGGYGCNLRCKFCQNYPISQRVPDGIGGENYTPAEVLRIAQQTPNNIGVAYTYNEPTMLFEFMLKTAVLVHNAGLYNVMVSNGYINSQPLEALLQYIDAFNIDLKAFSESFYHDVCGVSLASVLQTLVTIKNASRHLEVTFLVIPGLNDNADEAKQMFIWIAQNLGTDTPLHINRYFPMYKLKVPPTSLEKLEELHALAKQHLQYCYIGNIG